MTADDALRQLNHEQMSDIRSIILLLYDQQSNTESEKGGHGTGLSWCSQPTATEEAF